MTSWNAFTIDVEDWFQVSAFRHHIDRDSWPEREFRVERNMDILLNGMDRAGVRATCFVLGWVAERAPGLVRRISEAGHEIATHGQAHELVYDQSPAAFRECIHRSVETLRQTTGQPVTGHRAASFSLPRGERRWVYDVLAAEGVTYDSSIFPIRRKFYGHPRRPVDALRRAHFGWPGRARVSHAGHTGIRAGGSLRRRRVFPVVSVCGHVAIHTVRERGGKAGSRLRASLGNRYVSAPDAGWRGDAFPAL